MASACNDGDASHEASSTSSRRKKSLAASIGNFSIQYNFSSASFAVEILSSSLYLGHPLYTQPAWSKEVTLAVVFVGAMLGMLVMGRVGDVIGLSKAMRFTTSLSAVGAVLPAFATGSPDVVYAILSLGRLLLGVGVGGIYPLSAAKSAGGSSRPKSGDISWAFFWQTPGALVPYLVAMTLLAALDLEPPVESVPQFQFRCLFALGVIPAAMVFLATLREEDAPADADQPLRGPRTRVRGLGRDVHWTLLGTAGSWFCFDVAFYGTAVFTPIILDDICLTGVKDGDKCSQTLLQTAWQAVIVQLAGIPGVLLAVLSADRMGAKRLCFYGYLCLAVTFLVMAVTYWHEDSLGDGSAMILFCLFCVLNFFLNWGPNVGTYVCPAVSFPAHIRSTCHGISAFGGKAGAVLGTLLFPALKDSQAGLPGVLAVQVAFCLLGAVFVQVFLKHDWEYDGGLEGEQPGETGSTETEEQPTSGDETSFTEHGE